MRSAHENVLKKTQSKSGFGTFIFQKPGDELLEDEKEGKGNTARSPSASVDAAEVGISVDTADEKVFHYIYIYMNEHSRHLTTIAYTFYAFFLLNKLNIFDGNDHLGWGEVKSYYILTL